MPSILVILFVLGVLTGIALNFHYFRTVKYLHEAFPKEAESQVSKRLRNTFTKSTSSTTNFFFTKKTIIYKLVFSNKLALDDRLKRDIWILRIIYIINNAIVIALFYTLYVIVKSAL